MTIIELRLIYRMAYGHIKIQFIMRWAQKSRGPQADPPSHQKTIKKGFTFNRYRPQSPQNKNTTPDNKHITPNTNLMNLMKYKKPSIQKPKTINQTINLKKKQIPHPLSNYKRTSTPANEHFRAADRLQYMHYIDDASNVFYEDSNQMRTIRLFHKVRPYLYIVFVILLAVYFLISKITPYHGVCPSHADCGVFLECHVGYIQVDGRCDVDPKMKDQAGTICQAVILQLKFNYGNQQCAHAFNSNANPQTNTHTHTNGLLPPRMDIGDVFQQFNVNGYVLKQQINRFFYNRTEQKIHKFSISSNEIIPQQKYYSWNCKYQLFSQTHTFKYVLLGCMVLIILIIYLLIHSYKRSRAKEIFQFLHAQLQFSTTIDISELKTQMKQIFGRIDDEIWALIDKERVSKGNIVFYQDEHLHWKIYQ